ncbi:MAG: VanW family protein, partial [Actinomycetota bacterium]|nr:VanW family protein [Actinomycetota bacterium]
MRWLVRFVRYGSITLGSLLGVLVVLTLAERAVWRGKVLPGVSLSGVDVGGETLAQARRSIADRARALEHDRLVAVAGDEHFTFTPADMGLDLDEAVAVATVARAGRTEKLAAQALGVVTRRLNPLEVRWSSRFDDGRLARAVDRWAARFDRAPVDGGLRIDGATVTPVAPREGRTLLREEGRALVSAALHGRVGSPVHLPYQTITPQVGPAEVERAAAEAGRVLAGPATVVVEGREVTLSPARLGQALTVTPAGGHLQVDLPAAALHGALKPGLAGLEVAAVDARFVVDEPPPPAPVDPAAPVPAEPPPPPPPPTVRIEPSVTGRSLAAGPVAAALLAGERRVTGHLVDVSPAIDTVRAQTLRIVEPVSSFTTHHPAGQPRVKNIHRIADLLQNSVILPGDRFSLNEKVGPRTRGNGFVKAPVIYEGEFTEDIGGGVSQFATTFFNAAFFGGYEIVAHKPHTYYISRYPQGREATVSYPQPDLIIANNSTTGILVRTSYTESSITVTFFGDREGRTVRAEGPRVGKRQKGGYNVEVVRVIERPGQPPERQSFRTYYRTQPRKAPK